MCFVAHQTEPGGASKLCTKRADKRSLGWPEAIPIHVRAVRCCVCQSTQLCRLLSERERVCCLCCRSNAIPIAFAKTAAYANANEQREWKRSYFTGGHLDAAEDDDDIVLVFACARSLRRVRSGRAHSNAQ